MAKRKTLPNELLDLIKGDNHEEIIAILNKCEVDATFRSSDNTIFHVEDASYELLEYVIANGGNIERRDIYGNTVLHTFAKYIYINHFEKLLKLGADVNAITNDGSTPLHNASCYFRINNVKLLIENGANIHALNNDGDIPLICALKNVTNTQLSNLVLLSELYFELGIEITDEMKEQIVDAGKNFEFYRDKIRADILEEMEEAMNKLYQLYDVDPISKLVKHDGKEMISVPDLSLYAQHSKLWEYLVPGVGHAQTVQGEVIRVTGNVAREVLDNGGINWDRNFKKMCTELCKYLKLENKLDEVTLKDLKKITDIIGKSGNGSREDIEYLYTCAINWVKLNPVPIQLKKVNYKR